MFAAVADDADRRRAGTRCGALVGAGGSVGRRARRRPGPAGLDRAVPRARHPDGVRPPGRRRARPRRVEVERLGPADVPAMMDLVERAQPGPAAPPHDRARHLPRDPGRRCARRAGRAPGCGSPASPRSARSAPTTSTGGAGSAKVLVGAARRRDPRPGRGRVPPRGQHEHARDPALRGARVHHPPRDGLRPPVLS